jgi:regulation of enolase protein 1 (concanavalin A-like superfamily)
VGAVGAAGSASASNGTFTVRGAGADVWGTADAFHYAWQQVSGDVDVVARVASIQNVSDWVKAGVMIRETLTANSAHGFMLASPGKGQRFQRRVATGGHSTSTSGPTAPAPVWVKLERRGNVISAFSSTDGANWTSVGSDTFSMGATVYAGLAVSSHISGTLATATFDNVSVTPVTTSSNTPPTVSLTSPTPGASYTAPASVSLAANAADSDGTVARVEFYNGSALLATDTSSPYQASWTDVPEGSYTITARAFDNDGASTTSASVSITVTGTTPPPGLPEPWSSQDVGAVGVAGSASASGGAFTVRGAGADIWGTADGFHYAWQQATGDFDIVARVASVEWVHHWSKAGVMVRDSLAANSAQGFMLVSAGRGLAFQRRLNTGGDSVSTAGTAAAAPMWVKLERRGNSLSAYQSADGSTWTPVGSDTVSLGSTVYVGLAVTSHDDTRLASGTFDNVSVIAR